MDKVVIYDQNKNIVGETFPRRAKQLVLKERAMWLNENAITLLNAQEEEKMENNQYIDLRETAETPPHHPAPSEDLLMHLAKRNIRKRKELLVHIAAFFTSFVILLIITDGFGVRGGFAPEFFLGIYLTWGVFIAHKIFVQLRDWLTRSRPSKDALKSEYERLKAAPPTKINL
ncbi:MAG: hypothetical protein FWE21_08725 [Defluviitaleaceae bacterium]|nr:hypothetical protein [Defluviitaleaceae bacterium]